MATLDEIRQTVKTTVKDPDFSDDLITRHINAGYVHCAQEVLLAMLESTGAFDTVADQAIYDIPEAWEYHRELAQCGTEDGPLEVLSSLEALERIEKDYRNEDPGTPKYIIEVSGQLHLFPTPDAIMTYNVVFHRLPTSLSRDRDIPTSLPTALQEDLLANYTLARLFRVLEGGTMEGKPNYKLHTSEFLRALEQLEDVTETGQTRKAPQRMTNWI